MENTPNKQQQEAIDKMMEGTLKSPYPGIYWNKVHRKWLAQLRIGSKNHHFGLFFDDKEAFVQKEQIQRHFNGIVTKSLFTWWKARKVLKAWFKTEGMGESWWLAGFDWSEEERLRTLEKFKIKLNDPW